MVVGCLKPYERLTIAFDSVKDVEMSSPKGANDHCPTINKEEVKSNEYVIITFDCVKDAAMSGQKGANG
jgi:hypothetical protein